MATRCYQEDTILDKDRPRSSPCPRTLSKQETAVEREMVELPLAPSPSNVIDTIFAWLSRAWILQFIFRRPSSMARLESTTPSSHKPTQSPATAASEVKHPPKLPPPSSNDNPETDSPTQDWRLQMLMERRRREAERARHNPSIVVTFSGPTRVAVDKLSVAKRGCVADLSEDEEDCQPPLPFISSELVSRCDSISMAPCCSSPTEKQTSAFPECPRFKPRRSSPNSSDTAWEDSSSYSTQSRSSSPTRCEDMTSTEDESDEEVEECATVAHVLLEQD